MTCEDLAAVAAIHRSVELIPGENCCEYCLDPQCYGECYGYDMDGDFVAAPKSRRDT